MTAINCTAAKGVRKRMDTDEHQHLLHYEILAEMGEGDCGKVYKAWDTTHERLVALKEIKKEFTDVTAFRAHFLPTVQTLKHCNHPAVCRVYDIHQREEGYLLVTEFVEGISILEFIRRRPGELSVFLNLAVSIAEGLRYAHDNLVTHGNLKPSNILVTQNGKVKLTDFGLSTYPEGNEGSGIPPSMQSLAYVAPEQIGSKPVTQLVDMFSLGVIFYELLSGKLPFTGDTPRELLDAILHESPDYGLLREKGIPGDVILVVEKLLAKKAADRFSSAEELLITLQAVRSFERESAVREFLQVKPKTPRHYLLLSLLAVLLVIFWYVVTTYHF